MYAIIAIGNHQYKVKPDGEFTVFRREGEIGDEIELTDVLLVKDDETVEIGTPHIENARVVALIKEQFRGDKITIYNYKKRHGRRRKLGHRDDLTRLKVESIEIDSA